MRYAATYALSHILSHIIKTHFPFSPMHIQQEKDRYPLLPMTVWPALVIKKLETQVNHVGKYCMGYNNQKQDHT